MNWKSWELCLTQRFTLLIASYDWWVGGYYNAKDRHLYIMVPFIGIRYNFGKLTSSRGWFFRTVDRTWEFMETSRSTDPS